MAAKSCLIVKKVKAESLTTELKTIHSFWIPVRVLEELDRESKKKNVSRNHLAITFIENGLKNQLGGILEKG